MNKPVKVALLSASIFPGVGHFFLKKYVAAFALAGTASGCLYILIGKAVATARTITEKIQSGEVQLDTATIAELISQQTTGNEAQLIDIATAVLFASWLLGIIDSYRVGRAQDNGVVADADRLE